MGFAQNEEANSDEDETTFGFYGESCTLHMFQKLYVQI